MNELNKKAVGGLIFFHAAMGLFLFAPAGTLHYWQAWVYLGVSLVCTGSITLYLMQNDEALLERRMHAGSSAEKEKKQKLIQFISQFAFVAMFVVPALDHRYAWSSLPLYISIGADIFCALGLFIVFLVFKENTYTSAIIELADDQHVVSTGPYRFVRHPMYSGTLLMLLATPIALGSWWGLLAFIPMLLVIVWRLFEEERFLSTALQGYTEYQAKVPWRLLPFVF